MKTQKSESSLSASAPRENIIAKVRSLSPGLSEDDKTVSLIRGGRAAAEKRLAQLDPNEYGRTRNHLDGAVTQLSPYIRHGVIGSDEVRNRALEIDPGKASEKFIQQLTWREYWQHLYRIYPDFIWTDVEEYKTGFSPDDYADDLPEDIAQGETGVACLDQFIDQLVTTGWIHNHVRLYLAGYICHWRRVKWQAGAQWFLTHLLDGDPASNNLSWQWVASTFSHKPYYFNLDNVEKFSGPNIDTSPEHNQPLAESYETLRDRLFPNGDF